MTTHLDLVDEPASERLRALLGKPRATILLALDHPMAVGRVAELLRTAPSAATYHLVALEQAGLAARERAGRRVLVRRTARGSAVLALYDVSAAAP